MKIFQLLVCISLVYGFPNKTPISIKKRLGGRIIGGTPAYVSQFPFAAAINTITPVGNYFCGGTLLTNQWIVTAGQCVENVQLFNIRLGSNSLVAEDPYAVRASTDAFVLHPEYNSLTLNNDIGLIRLRLPVEYSYYLNQVEFFAFGEVQRYSSNIAIGWGQISDEDAGLVDDLHYVYVTALSKEECRTVYGNQITDSMVCVDGNYNEGTCIGDSGGPLIQIISRGYPVIVGIASFVSQNGCESTDPSGFTEFYGNIDWIKNVTGRAG